MRHLFRFFVPCTFRDLGWQQRYARFCGRIVVLSVLVLLLYPFLCVWTVIGTLWFCSARSCVSFLSFLSFSFKGFICLLFAFISLQSPSITCILFQWLQLPGEGQKWGFLIWLLFSYCGLVCIACMATGKVCTLLDFLFGYLCEGDIFLTQK